MSVDTASDEQLRRAFIGAFHTDLPLGYAKLEVIKSIPVGRFPWGVAIKP